MASELCESCGKEPVEENGLCALCLIEEEVVAEEVDHPGVLYGD